MKKVIALQILVLVLFSSLIIYLMSSWKQTYEIEKNEFETHLGQYYVIGKDSLKIVDYSIINDTFTLENGVEINKTLIIKNK